MIMTEEKLIRIVKETYIPCYFRLENSRNEIMAEALGGKFYATGPFDIVLDHCLVEGKNKLDRPSFEDIVKRKLPKWPLTDRKVVIIYEVAARALAEKLEDLGFLVIIRGLEPLLDTRMASLGGFDDTFLGKVFSRVKKSLRPDLAPSTKPRTGWVHRDVPGYGADLIWVPLRVGFKIEINTRNKRVSGDTLGRCLNFSYNHPGLELTSKCKKEETQSLIISKIYEVNPEATVEEFSFQAVREFNSTYNNLLGSING